MLLPTIYIYIYRLVNLLKMFISNCKGPKDCISLSLICEIIMVILSLDGWPIYVSGKISGSVSRRVLRVRGRWQGKVGQLSQATDRARALRWRRSPRLQHNSCSVTTALQLGTHDPLLHPHAPSTKIG